MEEERAQRRNQRELALIEGRLALAAELRKQGERLDGYPMDEAWFRAFGALLRGGIYDAYARDLFPRGQLDYLLILENLGVSHLRGGFLALIDRLGLVVKTEPVHANFKPKWIVDTVKAWAYLDTVTAPAHPRQALEAA